MSRSQSLVSLLTIIGLTGGSMGSSLLLTPPAMAQPQGLMELKLLRTPDSLEVVIEGTGSQPILEQFQAGPNWEGRLRTEGEPGLKRGPQKVAMPELGIKSVRLAGSGRDYKINIEALAGTAPLNPVVSSNGRNLVLSFPGLVSPSLQTGRLDLTTPGRVPQRTYAPPLRPRAIAPPLGDIAVGTMVIKNRSFVEVSGPPVTLTLNNAPAKDALMSLARLGGYGFVFVADPSMDTAGSDSSTASAGKSVTMTFQQETFPRALNSVLLASGLQGKLDGRTLLVGDAIAAKSFGPQMSKVFRMNQVKAASAANYLANLGAQISITNTSTTTSRESETFGTLSDSSESSISTKSENTVIETYGSTSGPLIGLIGTTDERLGTITLVGDHQLISIAEGYLKQIDLRKRQVAVKVQILNIQFENDKSIDSSFSAKLGNTFIVSENGNAFMNFGKYRPGDDQGTGLLNNGDVYTTPGSYSAGEPLVESKSVRTPYAEAQQIVRGVDGSQTLVPKLDANGLPIYVVDPNPNAPDVLVEKYDQYGRPILVSGQAKNEFSYPDSSFYSYLQAAIKSTSAKIIAEPTLLVQEGESAKVEAGQSFITGVDATEAANGSTQLSNTRETAGLILDVNVDKIDDNGFVSLELKPEISVPESAGEQQGVKIYNIESRKLNSGRIRLRDRQTLILTGVIQENDIEIASKWPLLGDLPLIGQLFRSNSSGRKKNELVIIVTPTILDDSNGGSYGYGYRAGTLDAQRLINQ